MKKVYLDYASLTPIDGKVFAFSKKYTGEDYMNSSSIHEPGISAKRVLKETREITAKAIGASADEIIFTGSGTEANNIALQPSSLQNIVISNIEHSSIMKKAEMLEKDGIKVSRIKVLENGIIDLKSLKDAIGKETALVSVMLVNNETGVIQPIKEIARIIKEKKKEFNSLYPLFHTDACQAISTFKINARELGVDMMTLDSHKAYGPRGVGMLYIRRGVEIKPIMFGGEQEMGIRAGTENLPGIAGFAFALSLCEKNAEKENKRLASLKKYFIEGLRKINPEIKINGDLANSSPHILNISIPGIDAEFMVIKLSERGVFCSTKSACLYHEDESYVLKAMNADSKSSLRFSFGRNTKKNDLAFALKMIKDALID